MASAARDSPATWLLTAGSRLRDWLLANDPAFSRARLGLRVSLTVLLSAAVLAAVHLWVVALPPAAYAIGIVLAIQGGLSVRDALPSDQLKTRIIGCGAGILAIALAAVLEPLRHASDLAFLAVIFAAAYGRAFGPRWFAVGMFAVMSYFIGAYLHPPVETLPLVATGAVVAAVTAHGVRRYLLPDDWRRDFLRAMESVLGRVDHILAALLAVASRKAWTQGDRDDLNRLEDRLKEAVLMADGLVPVRSPGALPEEDDPAADIGIRLFDLHLAAESAIVVSRQWLPPAALVSAVLQRHDRTAVAWQPAGATPADDSAPGAETARALVWLQEARAAAVETTQQVAASDFEGLKSPSPSVPSLRRPRWSLQDPALRMALQITLASGIAMVFGLMLSRERWFWAVLSAFLVFTNTNSRGDTAIKAAQRSGGTLLGIASGMVLATLLSGHPVLAGVIAAICVFLAFYWLQVSYATMTFFVSIVICLVYSLTGALTSEVLRLRIEETAIGALAGTAVAFFVLPTRTQAALDTALGRWFGALRDLLASAAGAPAGSELIALSKKLDAAYRDVAAAARPLGVSWQLVTRPGHIRQTLAILMACTYWARIFASRMAFASDDDRRDVVGLIAEALLRLDRVSARGSACFFVKRRIAAAGGRHLPLSRKGSRLGIEMIGATLQRLYPADQP